MGVWLARGGEKQNCEGGISLLQLPGAKPAMMYLKLEKGQHHRFPQHSRNLCHSLLQFQSGDRALLMNDDDVSESSCKLASKYSNFHILCVHARMKDGDAKGRHQV